MYKYQNNFSNFRDFLNLIPGKVSCTVCASDPFFEFWKFDQYWQFLFFFDLFEEWWRQVRGNRINRDYFQKQDGQSENVIRWCYGRGFWLYRRRILRWLRICVASLNPMSSFCAIVQRRYKCNHFETKQPFLGRFLGIKTVRFARVLKLSKTWLHHVKEHKKVHLGRP